MKKCSKCKIYTANFGPNKKSKDRLASWCRNCCKELERKRRKNIGIKPKIVPKVFNDKEKECLYCFTVKPLESFNRNNRGRCGRSAYCYNCQKKYLTQDNMRKKATLRMRKWRKENKDRWRFMHRCNMLKRRAEMVIANTGLVTIEFLTEIYNKEEYYYCKRLIERANRTCEHILPISRGGLHHPKNIVMACISCNSSKGRKTLEEWNDKGGSGL